MTNTLKRQITDTDFMDSTSKPWKGKGKSVAALGTTRPRTAYHDQQEKVFANFRLKRILRENHGCDINQLSLFFKNDNLDRPQQPDLKNKHGAIREQNDTSNILASVGGAQISIYDNEHIGDNLDIISNFNLASTLTDDQDPKQKILNTFCWLYLRDDAVIATGGADNGIHILSMTQSKETAILKGHSKPILDIQKHPQDDKYILSVSKDGFMRLWDVEQGRCMIMFEYQCNVACFHPSGNTFITGTVNGELREWTIPVYALSATNTTDEDDPVMIDISNSRLLKKMHGESTIDCIRFANGNVLSKSINGRMEYWDPTNEEIIRSFRIKTGENHSRFDITLDGLYFCVGSNRGIIYIYNLENGRLVSELSHRRSTKAVRCCIFTHDCRQLLCGGEEGLIWRYEYIDDATLELLSQWKAS
ncbi:hypothetical protein [Absidia glauca]|uniref:Uncharacterized protein n=1 Tax=Absidia glauca TaxID=4829 RepID=A0A163KY52_ABSGL|nr:hypothetical protein [Absidia glauca]